MKDGMLIPEQREGGSKDFEYGITLTSLANAKGLFDIAKHRLLHIDKWHEYAGMMSADFVVEDSDGTEQRKAVAKGDFIKIDIPGPSAPNEEYDWVKVEDIRYEMPEENSELLFLQLRPCTPPGEEMSADVAHFFGEGSSSSFILKREGRDVHISYHGRNEVANTDTDNTGQNVRNWLVGLSAKLGFSNMQWKNLIKGILTTQQHNIDNDKNEDYENTESKSTSE